MFFIFIAVRFLQNASSADESEGSIAFTVVSSIPSVNPFTVQVCTREIVPVSAEGLFIILNYARCANTVICIHRIMCIFVFVT